MSPALLIIDDNPSVRESLVFLFEHRGYRVSAADGGVAGIALAKEQAFDGAIVDVNMPGMDGVQTCRALKAQAEKLGRPLPVWMMTGVSTSEVIRAAKEAGAITVFSKPFDFPELFRHFDAVMGPVEPPKAPADPLDDL